MHQSCRSIDGMSEWKKRMGLSLTLSALHSKWEERGPIKSNIRVDQKRTLLATPCRTIFSTYPVFSMPLDNEQEGLEQIVRVNGSKGKSKTPDTITPRIKVRLNTTKCSFVSSIMEARSSNNLHSFSKPFSLATYSCLYAWMQGNRGENRRGSRVYALCKKRI